jgi:hypothetical protein
VNEQPVNELGPSSVLQLERRKLLVILIGFCCVGFFIADVATPLCFDELLPAFLTLGIVTAQLSVICVWGTLVRGTFWIRLPWTLLLLMLSWCGFAYGLAIKRPVSDSDSMLAAGIVWMMGFITSFIPLKVAAICFRWQIVQHTADISNPDRSSRFAIRDMMVGTLLLALSMAVARVMLPNGEEISFERAVRAGGFDKPVLLLVISIYGVVSLLVKLPCIWIALGEKAEKIGARIVFWVFYCFALAVVEFVLFALVAGSPGAQDLEAFVGVVVSHQLMGTIMLGICLALRGLGYRLHRSAPGTQTKGKTGDTQTLVR